MPLSVGASEDTHGVVTEGERGGDGGGGVYFGPWRLPRATVALVRRLQTRRVILRLPESAAAAAAAAASRKQALALASCLAVAAVLGLIAGAAAYSSAPGPPPPSTAFTDSLEQLSPLAAAWGGDSEATSGGRKSKRTPQRAFGKTSFGLGEIIDNKFRAERWNGTWASDTEYAYRDRTGGLSLLSVLTQQSQQIVPRSEMTGVFKYWLSPNRDHILLAMRPQKLFRHSFLAQYDVYNIGSGERTKVEPPPEALDALGRPPPPGPASPSPPSGPQRGPQQDNPFESANAFPGGPPPPQQLPLTYATWAKRGNALAYVFGNNIYYRSSPKGQDVQVTTTGIPGTVFNGVSDWVYEEEVISDTRALWFSPDSRYIAWIEFNDTAVDLMPLTVYGQPGNLQFQYPIPTPIRYPKPGRTNPFVNVYYSRVGRRSRPNPILLQPPRYFEDREKIIYAVTWASDSEVSLTWENRHQNYSIVSVCDVGLASCKDALVMTQPGGWMELDQAPVYTADGKQFAMVLPAEGYKHVNVINRDTNQRVPVTSGEMVVVKIYHWDETQHVIYFKGTREGSPGERHLYTVTDFESGRPGIVTCISCGATNSRGGQCGYNSFKFSEGKTYYTMSCLGPHVPQDYLYKTQPNQKIGTLVTNAFLSNELAKKNLPKISNLDVAIDGGKYVAKTRLYLPPDFSENKKYPILVNVYAGPNSQQVNDRFKLDWGTYLTTNEDIIYATIDGRGSGYRGDDLLFEIYYNLGKPEVQDQIDVVKKLADTYNFIDRDNIAIWGWSYGGFVTTSVLAADADQDNIFKCGIAVAPVTNWIYYDTIYTERFMGLPTPGDNLRGYEESDVTRKANKFRNKKVLLVHGTADDNVHYQQTMMLTRALEEADVLFDQLSYPDEAHGIVGLRPHFYHSLSDFILNDCFGRNEVVEVRPAQQSGLRRLG